MDPNALDVLEFPAIRERVARATATEHGAALAAELEPSPDPGEVARRQALTAEAIALLDESLEPPLDRISDVREPGGPRRSRRRALAAGAAARLGHRDRLAACPRRARRGGRTAPARARGGDRPGARARRQGDRPRGRGGRLRPARQRLAEAPQAARRAPDRPAARARQARAARPLERAARAPAGGVHHPPWRPARAGREGERPPQRAGNRPRRVRLRPDAVRRAVRRRRALQPPVGGDERGARGGRADPARALGRRRRARAPLLAAAVEATGQIDLAIALGTLSRGWKGAPVEVVGRGAAGRQRAIRCSTRRSAVPIDLDLGSLRALVISGPNTGGKTVALKTLGLAALLHQAGLRPARRDGRAARLRPGARRHRRPAVDRDEPLDLLRPRREHRRDPERGRRAVARAARRARLGHRSRSRAPRSRRRSWRGSPSRRG